MKTVFKYEANQTNPQLLSMPKGAKVLSFQFQANVPYIWAEVDTSQSSEERWFRLFGTGEALTEEKLEYRGTAQRVDSFVHLVLHLYEVMP